MQPEEWQLAQYRMLREEILLHTVETRRLEIYAIAGVAALYAWLSAAATVAPAAWFIGVLIPVFGGLRSFVLFERIRQIASYLREIEAAAFTQEGWPRGWERWFKDKHPMRLSLTAMAYWWALFAATLVAPLILGGAPG